MPGLGTRSLLAGCWIALACFLAVLPVLGDRAAAQTPQPLTLRDGRDEVQILADRMDHVGGPTDLLIAEGNVEITRGGTRLLADRVEINRATGEAVAQGKVVFYDGEDRLVGARVDYNLKTGTGVVYRGSAFSAPYYSLSGERMDRLGEGVYQIREGVFTTCEGEEPDWSIRVGSATADLNEIIYGRDASFWVRNIPLIPWVPFFAAAIRRERQSGFLFPQAGYSSRKGASLRVPYYWAIDDSQDATISLDTFTRRGVGLSGEYRYVLSRDHHGMLNGFGIWEGLREDQELRGHAGARHFWQLGRRTSLTLDSLVTSDDRIFRDYADRLHDRTLQRAETNLFFSHRWDAWTLVGNVLWYQDLTQPRPVELQRAPEIRLTAIRQPVPGLPALLYEVESSFTNFVRDVGSDGVRLDLHPRTFLPVPVFGYVTLTPFLGGRLTYYDKRVVGLHDSRGTVVERTVHDDRVRRQIEGGIEAEARATRVFPVDGTWNLAALQHVVEPRATWTEIRGLDQKALPQYDPAIDRIGKVSEVTYSLTNRLNAKTVSGADQEAVRWEMVRLLLSQSVNLLPDANHRFRPVRADLILQPNRTLYARADASWDVYGRGVLTANADIGIRTADFNVSAGTRFDDRAELHVVRGEVSARLTRHVDARAATHYDVRGGTPVENRVGVDLHFQCWAILLEYVDRHRSEDEFRFAIHLLGVGQTGGRTGTGLR
jgi:LPS-assembly protein